MDYRCTVAVLLGFKLFLPYDRYCVSSYSIFHTHNYRYILILATL